MKSINLKQLSVDDLLTMRDRINAVLARRVDQERRDLEARLNRLQRFKAGTAEPGKTKSTTKIATKLAKKVKSKGPKKKVPAKYCNPDDLSETWAGRGLQPRWLRAAIKAGKKIEDFQISAKH